MAGNVAWRAFCRRPRIEAEVSARVEEEPFWREIRPLIERVGLGPVLVVSRHAEGRVLRRMLHAPASDRPRLTIEQRPQHDRRGSYIATIEGVDVFGAEFPAGEAWLFSAKSLRAIHYAKTDPAGRYAELTFELGEEMKGTLRVRVRQELEWSGTLIFELKVPDPGVSNGE